MASELYTRLVNEGPLSADQIPDCGISYELRADGVRTFNPTSNTNGNSLNGTGRTKPVYWIDGKHTPLSVIRLWLEVNPRVMENLPKRAVHSRVCDYSSDFIEASRSVLGPFDGLEYGDNRGEMEESPCPLCGEPVKMLPDHLPCDE